MAASPLSAAHGTRRRPLSALADGFAPAHSHVACHAAFCAQIPGRGTGNMAELVDFLWGEIDSTAANQRNMDGKLPRAIFAKRERAN